ncbi:MAG: M56 family metallopeptidase [Planctomycetota bacterium]|nr:M56 family metallopeptidase [Planctomycetota bacterium]
MGEFLQASHWLADSWASAIWRASWQGSIAIVIALIACQLMRSAPAWTRCWLWRLVDVKFLIVVVLLTPLRLPILPANAGGAQHPLADADLPLYRTEDSVELSLVTQPPLVASLETRQAALVACFTLWMIGVLVRLVLLGLEWRRASQIQREPILTPSLLDACEELSAKYGLRSPPRLTSSPAVAVPLLMGMIQPTIVLPERALTSCSSHELRLILSHELGHVRRADLWWSWLPAIVHALFFFHPLVWFAHRQWRLSREMACDELAIIQSKSQVTDYAKALMQVAVHGSEHLRACRAFSTVSVSESSTSLRRRLVAMRHFRSPSRFRSIAYAAALVSACLFGVIPWQPVARAQKTEDAPPKTEPASQQSLGSNMGFEEQAANSQPEFWAGGGKGYSLTLDGEVKHSGKLSGKIASLGEGVGGSYTQCMTAAPLLGKRVSYTGFIKTDIKNGHAGLWMRVDGGDRKVLSFDNMSDRPIKGVTDWKEYEVVLDVPESATGICFGFLIQGSGGNVWGDDLKIRIVGDAGQGSATTGMFAETPMNTDFEEKRKGSDLPESWGGGGKGYLRTRDAAVAHNGAASGRIEQQDASGTFGSLTQSMDAEKYLGKRIKYTGYLKTNEAKAAGLWLRVDGKSKPLGFDNMQNRPIRGTTDWTEYHVVLDVPEEATRIVFGFLLGGSGTIWGDDLAIEIVGPAGEGTATTGIPIP